MACRVGLHDWGKSYFNIWIVDENGKKLMPWPQIVQDCMRPDCRRTRRLI